MSFPLGRFGGWVRSHDPVAVGVVLTGLVAVLSYAVVPLTRDVARPEQLVRARVDRPQYVVVVTGQGSADTLVAASLGDLVLTLPSSGELSWLVADVQLLKPTSVLILGGPEVVSAAAAAALSAATAAPVTRLAGPDRYTTAAQAASTRFEAPVASVLVAVSERAPVAAGAVGPARPPEARPCLPSYRFCGTSAPTTVAAGTPVLLVTGTRVPPATRRALQRLRPRSLTITGTVSEAVVQELERHTSGEVTSAPTA